jgi:hypothetical protein
VAQQVAHAAQTLDWFVEGASKDAGFDLDFEKHAKSVGNSLDIIGLCSADLF